MSTPQKIKGEGEGSQIHNNNKNTFLYQKSTKKQRGGCCPHARASDDKVADHLGVDDLGDNVLVGKAHNKAVLGAVVLVLVLADKTHARKVVGLALAPKIVFF
jgi:hypothetical protein